MDLVFSISRTGKVKLCSEQMQSECQLQVTVAFSPPFYRWILFVFEGIDLGFGSPLNFIDFKISEWARFLWI